MTQLILVRHGVTELNEQRRYIGSTDLELSSKGIAQAEALSARLRNEPVDLVFSSETKRTVQTARMISKPHNLAVSTMQDLNEVDFGKWEGLNFEEIEQLWPDFIARWLSGESGLPPQGEPIGSFQQRVNRAIKQILGKNNENCILLVAHAGTIKLIICYFLSLNLSAIWKMRQDTASISKIEFFEDGVSTLNLLNDVCHLTPELR
jgi:alpha-ribazole phosphatase